MRYVMAQKSDEVRKRYNDINIKKASALFSNADA